VPAQGSCETASEKRNHHRTGIASFRAVMSLSGKTNCTFKGCRGDNATSIYLSIGLSSAIRGCSTNIRVLSWIEFLSVHRTERLHRNCLSPLTTHSCMLGFQDGSQEKSSCGVYAVIIDRSRRSGLWSRSDSEGDK
jgi:hypothetical protein